MNSEIIYIASFNENIEVSLPYSKSILNRYQIISFLANKEIDISDRFVSGDNRILDKQLQLVMKNLGQACELNVQDSGTAMRFLISLLCITPGEWMLNGSHRLKQRPVRPLVEVLNLMGGKIEFLDKEGFLPIKIISSDLKRESINLPSNISSQFISSLMLISPFVTNGMKLSIDEEQVSLSYIKMTFELMKMMGAEIEWSKNNILIQRSAYKWKNIAIERDWSSASYWFLIASFIEGKRIILKGLSEKSLQGDSALKELFSHFGVISKVFKEDIIIERKGLLAEKIEMNLGNHPDIAPALIVASAAFDIPSKYSGLQHLKFKESDRLKVLEAELCKLGFNVESNGEIFTVKKKTAKLAPAIIHANNDHRIAMSLIPLAILIPGLYIDNKVCIDKSYPNFIADIEKAGLHLK